MSRVRWTWCVGAAVLGCVLTTTVIARQSEQQPPTFRGGTTAVLLDIVVRDKKGRPVRDLQQSEITVVDDGQPRAIQSFRLVEGAAAPAQLESAAGASLMQPDPLRRITLVSLVFDQLSQNARRLAFQAAKDFVSKPRMPGEWVAVFSLDQRLRLQQDFTRDQDALIRAVERASRLSAREEPTALPGQTREQQPSNPDVDMAEIATGPGGADGGAFADRAIREVTQRMQMFADSAEAQQRGQSTLFPLMALAKAQGRLEGRKAIMLFSEGFRVPPNMEEAFSATISEANRANVSFYAVDARGLDTSRSLEAAGATLNRAARVSQQQQARRGGPVTMEEVMNEETAAGALTANVQGKLEELAESTGGFLVANSNDLRKGLEKVTSDLASYYEIAYTPQGSELDGRFRKVEVKVARRGVDVQTRSGYFALPATDGAPLLPYELPLLAAVNASSPPRAFEYSSGVFRFHETPKGRQHTLVVEVPLEHLTFNEDRKAKKYTLRFSVMALVKDANGRIVERMSNSYPLEGPLDRLPALKHGNIVFKRQLWLPPGRYTVDTVARDQDSDRVSVERLTVEVPGAGLGVRLSTPAVIKRVDQATADPEAVQDPFRSGPMRIVPSLDTPISKSSTPQISAFVIIYSDRTQATAPQLTFEFVKEGKTLGRATPELPAADERGEISYVASFPSETFAPGTYELRAHAHQGSTEDEARVAFTVVP
jgi:VWFA-related protein